MSRRVLFKATVTAIAGLGLTRPASVPAHAATPLELAGDAVTTAFDFEGDWCGRLDPHRWPVDG